MGRWEQLKALIKGKKKVIGGKDRYILKRQGSGGGMKKAMELTSPVTLEEVYPHLEAGIYALHKYSKGQSGFTVVWGPAQVIGQAESLREKASTGGRILTAKDKLKEALAPLEEMRELSSYYEEHFGMGAFVKAMEKGREQYTSLAGIYGERTSGEEAIKYDGNLPIWMHPRGIPALIGNSLDQVEGRLVRWGLISKGTGEKTIEKSLMDMPSRPDIKTNPDEKPAIDVKFPEKPSLGIEKKKVGTEEGGEKGGNGEEGKGSE